MSLLKTPYIEEGLSKEQNLLRQNGSRLVTHVINSTELVSKDSKLIGFADNGVSAVVAIIESDKKYYVLKIKPKFQPELNILLFLKDSNYPFSIKIFGSFEVTFENILCNCEVLEYIDVDRASHADLSKSAVLDVIDKLGDAVSILHGYKTQGYGSVNEASDVIYGEDRDFKTTLKVKFKTEKFADAFSDSKSVICHHELGLHNVFYLPDRSIKIFDFKPLLLPKEFDLAMFIVWNKFRGEVFIETFLKSYEINNDFSSELLDIALLLEYNRKLEIWKKRLANNNKVLDWIKNAENEISRLSKKIGI